MTFVTSSLRYPSVYEAINRLESKLAAWPELKETFRRCYSNTLETTVELLEDGTTFVITGDIPAMWLRDSSAQMLPYVQYAKEDETIRRAIAGLIRRQAMYILIDPYANAFNREPNGKGHPEDRTAMLPWVWERKFELDSLCYPVQLLNAYYKVTRDRSLFDSIIYDMLHVIVNTMQTEQRHDEKSAYTFERDSQKCVLPTDTLPFDGKGTPTNYTGMVWSGFRPSDDACTFGYLIPANMFAVVILDHIARFARDMYHDQALATQALTLQAEIEFGIQTYSIVAHPRYGRIYAYETDGYGNTALMDDSNVPSLLSIPYLGYHDAHDPIYQNTRAFVLSHDNPYYYSGQYAAGIGSPHTPAGYIWPMSLVIQGLTATDPGEQKRVLDMLLATTSGTNLMHESFDPNAPANYTRPWFAWANSLFGDLICQWAARM